MHVTRWGNSLGVRLSKAVADKLGITQADEIEIGGAADGLLSVRRKRSKREALQSLRKYRGSLPIGFKIDRASLHDR